MADDPPATGPEKPLLDRLVDIAKGYQASLPQLVSTNSQANMEKQIHHSIRRAEAQADAGLKQCNPDYVPPEREEDDMSVLLNGVFIGGDEVKKIIDSEINNPPTTKPVPPPTNGTRPWWKWLLSVLLGALLVLLALWLYQKWFPPGGGGTQPIYSIIAEPWEPPLAEIEQ